MTRAVPKVPLSPPGPLRVAAGGVRQARPFVWRIHRTTGAHVLPWDRLREYGPLATMRWDPQEPPAAEHPGEGVMYAAQDVETAVAEAFQVTHRIELVAGTPRLTGWTPTRDLRLLDLTGDWALRNGGAHALVSQDRRRCRSWARQIRRELTDLDGLWWASTMTGAPSVVLWAPAAATFPPAPAFSDNLTSPLVASVIARAAQRIGYGHY